MGAKRKMPAKRKRSNCPPTFQTLISSIRSKQGLKSQTMKDLYQLLLLVSLKETTCCSNSKVASDFLSMEFKITYEDVHAMSDILFEKLDVKFNEFFLALHDVSLSQASGQSIFHWDVNAAIEEITLLLRCCIVIFTLLGFDICTKLVFEKGQVLLSILRRLFSVKLRRGTWESHKDFQKSVSYEHVNSDGGCTTVDEDFVASISFLEQPDPCHALLCALLEVFADELLKHKSASQYLLRVDSFSSPTEIMFMRDVGHGDDIGCVLEVISAHLILSVSDEQAFESFLSKLFWQQSNYSRIPEMSLDTALSLLFEPIIMTAPKNFQAYLILLVCDVIGISKPSKHIIPDVRRLMGFYLKAFEGSVFLYKRQMSNLDLDGHPIVGDDSFVKSSNIASKFEMDFESYLLSATRKKIDHLITNSNELWNLYLSNTSRTTKSDLVTASIAYVKESLNVFDESFRDHILSILSCVILLASSDGVDDFLLHRKDTSPQDIFLLASILKLMSCTMLQALWCLTNGGNSGPLKTLKEVSSRKEYDTMVATFDCFQQFSICLPIQKFLRDIMEIQPMRHKKSKWMLFHISALLSLSYVAGLPFLVKDCIFMLMILLDFFLFEEGNLDALGPLLGSKSNSSMFKSFDNVGEPEYLNETAEAVVDRKRSQAVALKFQKIRTLYLGTNMLRTCNQRAQDEQPENLEKSPIVNHQESSLGIVEENLSGTCNGEIFLKCVLEGPQKLSDFDDLVDFIECKEGKDYSEWLMDREKFRQRWQYEKKAKLRWKRKQRIRKNNLWKL
ncbi:hypothetical protein SLEP1_g43537 [Rubroshorea leprosula]|uniref:DUF7812 domain-containing protein n=1 Tax=Rubroshorea leprosula TaxID=152421 RepID=A0AAV5LDE7_9ROSI|nr:hypothetical protein SLEP1_g43537 [Rubroshorea leprosula]